MFTHVAIAKFGGIYLVRNVTVTPDGDAIRGEYVFIGDQSGRFDPSEFPTLTGKEPLVGLFRIDNHTIIKL